MDTEAQVEPNRRSWNAATIAHNSHKRDQARFFRAGGNTLFPEEIELLGDVRGRTLVHLQCNAGQDTLSLARLGAMITGVDISDEAIGFARSLSRDSGTPARFERAEVGEWLEQAAQAASSSMLHSARMGRCAGCLTCRAGRAAWPACSRQPDGWS